MENVYQVKNFLLPEELEMIEYLLTDKDQWAARSERKEDPGLGRVMYTVYLPSTMLDDIQKRVQELVHKKLPPISAMWVTYDAKYGQPNLPPHFDGDQNSMIVDYQYKSNTTWGFGVGKEIFEMEDNEAVIFNPNEYPHWRTHKTFEDGEFVTMIFFRFPDFDGDTDYSHLRYSQDDPIFDDIRKIRDADISEGIS